jgi:hypothetical protein
MKNYYIFSKEGHPIKVEKTVLNLYNITLQDKSTMFTKEQLIEQLEKFLIYFKKFG